MHFVSLAGTDLRTSRLGFGTSGLHQLLSGRRRQCLLAATHDLGVRHYDTSPFYGHGIAERELGLFSRNLRSEIVIATKFGIEPGRLFTRAPALMYAQLTANAAQRRITGRNLLARMPRHDYTARGARLSLERSLTALRTDHVDIYFLHDPSLALLGEAGELLRTLDELRRAGKARYIGLAGNARDCAELAQRYPSLAQVLQINAAPGPQELEIVRQSGLVCHVSFGHFRSQRSSTASLVAEAARQNTNGVVLYSSRFEARVAEVVGSFAGPMQA